MSNIQQIDRLAAQANKRVPYSDTKTRHKRRCGIALAVAQGLTDDNEILIAANRYAAN